MKIKAIIFTFLFLIMSAVFVLIFFPYSYFKKPVELMFLNKYGIRLKIAGISPSNLLDLNLNGIKILNPGDKGVIALVKNVKIYDAAPAFAAYYLFKKTHLNIGINGINTNRFKNGFLNIPGLNFKKSFLNIYLIRLKSGVNVAGRIDFKGNLSGKVSHLNIDIGRFYKIHYARLVLKPDKKTFKDLSFILSSAFTRKGKYFIYTVKNIG